MINDGPPASEQINGLRRLKLFLPHPVREGDIDCDFPAGTLHRIAANVLHKLDAFPWALGDPGHKSNVRTLFEDCETPPADKGSS